jgi:hypothetical protein
MEVYCAARPGGERLADSARVSEMIASAVLVNPAWFWKTFRKQPISAAARSRTERAMCEELVAASPGCGLACWRASAQKP